MNLTNLKNGTCLYQSFCDTLGCFVFTVSVISTVSICLIGAIS